MGDRKYWVVGALAAAMAANCLMVAAMTVSSFHAVRLYLLAASLIVAGAAAAGWRQGFRLPIVAALVALTLSWLPFGLTYFFMVRF